MKSSPIFCLLFLILVANVTVAQQTTPEHWETIVYDTTHWKYFPGESYPGTDWYQVGYNDKAWNSAKGGFGYGDNDDATVVTGISSIFLRKEFTVDDISKITDVFIHVDFDDGFVAYLNGVEVARANMASSFPMHNEFSNALREATLYQGLPPERFSAASIHDVLVEGVNTLAIQVHNADATSSDLTLRAFVSVGIADDSFTYYETPSWFVAPVTFKSSNLPILVIDTDGQQIVDEPEIIASLGIIDNTGARNNITDPFNGYDGKVELEFRGESSQMFPKKSLKVKTVDDAGNDRTVSLLGMPAEDDWVLYAPYTDKTMLRDALSYMLGNRMGQYATRTRFCEVVINGEYSGVYILMERIKQDKNRVDIAKLTEEDLSGDDLTGGYILRVDKIDANDYPAWASAPDPRLPNENVLSFQYVDPDGEDLAPVQKQYIKDFIYQFQSSLTRTDFKNATNGYKRFIDIRSFADFMLINEVNKNVDAYIYSTYMNKDKDSNGGKLSMGPLWDFNLAFGNVDYHPNSQFAPGWMYNDNYRMFWFRRMMQDQVFADTFACQWIKHKETILNTTFINHWIDSMAVVLEEAQVRNYAKWPILGTYVWPNQYVGSTYQNEINYLKNWIDDRLNWMEDNLPTTCKPPAEVVTNVENENSFGVMAVFPNPSSGGFTFRLKKKPNNAAYLSIYNGHGQLVLGEHISQDTYRWEGAPGTGIPQGIYIYTVTIDGRIVTGKIIRN